MKRKKMSLLEIDGLENPSKFIFAYKVSFTPSKELLLKKNLFWHGLFVCIQIITINEHKTAWSRDNNSRMIVDKKIKTFGTTLDK